jgi:anti-sigma B factor antagonist
MDYMNSSGLNVLVNILTKARSHSGEVVVSNVSGKVKELFLITKLNTLFQVTESLEEAEKVLH